MATNINDLFVSYKAVAPDTSQQAEQPEIEDMFPDLFDDENVGRAEKIAAKQADEENASDNGTDEKDEDEDKTVQQGWVINNLKFDQDNGSSNDEALYRSESSAPQMDEEEDKNERAEFDADMQKFFEKRFKENGIHAKVTSYRRKPGQAGNAGDKSWHTKDMAIDIVPEDGYSFEDLYDELIGSENIVNLFRKYNLGLLDETKEKTMKKTGAKGKHLHIGPDQVAVAELNSALEKRSGKEKQGRTENAKGAPQEDSTEDWVRKTNSSYLSALKKKYGNRYSESDYERIAAYMTAQSANETGWGKSEAAQKKNNNGGYLSGGKTMAFSSPDEFSNRHVANLDSKWKGFMDSNSLEDYIEKINSGEYRYFAEPGVSTHDYYERINGCLPRVLNILGKSMRLGGKFTSIRQLYRRKYA